MPETAVLRTHLTRDQYVASQRALAAQLSQGLPNVLRRGLAAEDDPVLDVLADTLAPGDALLTMANALFDPATAPKEVLPWLASWFGWSFFFMDAADPRRSLDLPEAFPPGPDGLRALLVAFPQLQALRGKAEGLRQTLRAATCGAEIDVSQDPQRQHLTVTIPGDIASWRPWITRFVAAERPAHLTFEVVLRPEMPKANTP